MCEKFSAAFVKRKGEIEVFCVHDSTGSSYYLGTLDTMEGIEDIYEGKFVFNLDAGYLVSHDISNLHIPLNVLGEIADYEKFPKGGLSGAAPRSKARLTKRRLR